MTARPTIPPVGLGTWGRTGDEGQRAIGMAIDVGYRHFDTAQTYGSEAVIGRALRDAGLSRDAVFLTTKVADTHLARKDFLPSVRASLDRLGVEAVDLLLIHWPVPDEVVPLEEYVAELVRAKALGLTRLIGVSNFPVALVERAVTAAGMGEIVTNQVEVHPFLQNRRLRACCAGLGIVVTAYMPLAAGRVMSNQSLARLAARYGESPATVVLAWLLHHGLVVIPASARREHLVANLRATGLRLEPSDIVAIDALERGDRIVNPAKSPAWD
jgi:2,5-diketo-D-gluconate reductase B